MKPVIAISLGAAGILAAIGTAVANANGLFVGHPSLAYWFWGASFALIIVAIAGSVVNSKREKKHLGPIQDQSKGEDKPNIKLIEIKTVKCSISGGNIYSIPGLGGGRFPTVILCLRNESLQRKILKQPQVNAHIVYRDFKRNEIGSLSHGVWIEEQKDYTTLSIGATKCLVLLTQMKGTIYNMVWQEPYYTNESWMGDGPSFRVRDREIDGAPYTVIVELLDHWKGTRIKRFVLRMGKGATGLPTLKAQSAFWSFGMVISAGIAIVRFIKWAWHA
jgi:hypothetical protein